MKGMATALTEIQATPPGKRAGKYLVFRLDGEDYAFPVLRVQEIIRWTVVTRVPRMPDFVRGVINLRGKVVPVIDLHARFGLAPVAVTPRTCIIVLQVQRDTGLLLSGVVVDEATEVAEVAPEEILPPPEFGSRISTAFIAGVGRVSGQGILLLNVDKILDHREWTSVEKVLVEKEQVHE